MIVGGRRLVREHRISQYLRPGEYTLLHLVPAAVRPAAPAAGAAAGAAGAAAGAAAAPVLAPESLRSTYYVLCDECDTVQVRYLGFKMFVGRGR